jgi:hypothetical protein
MTKLAPHKLDGDCMDVLVGLLSDEREVEFESADVTRVCA